MDLDFTKEQEMLRKSVAEFLAKECPSDTVKEIEDSEVGYSKQMWKKMADLGWMELCLPEAYGGLEDPFINQVILMEEMGKKALPSPYFSTVVQCATLLMEGASEAQKKKLLPKIARGKMLMAFAQLEEDVTYDETGIHMTATLEGDQVILNGTKMFVMDANIADSLIVVAKDPSGGCSLFLVDNKTAGITCQKMETIGKDNNCVVKFDTVKIPKDNLIGEPGKGWDIVEAMWDKAVVAKSAEMTGGCVESLDLTVGYSKQRVQYGDQIGAYQALQHNMADMKIGRDTSQFYLYKTAWMIDQNLDVKEAASVLKAHVNERYKFITERGVQIHGGVGTTREFDIGLFYRRAKSFEYVMGDTDFHYERVAALM